MEEHNKKSTEVPKKRVIKILANGCYGRDMGPKPPK